MSLHYLVKLLLWTRSTVNKLLMVFVGMSRFGKTDLIFVDPEVKINGAYWHDVLLTEQLLPVVCEISGEFFYLPARQHSSHRACETISWEMPAFISPDLWLSQVQIWTQLTIAFERNAAAALPDESSWHWWTDAACDMSGAWLVAKCDQWHKKWVAQTSLRVLVPK